MPKCRKCSHKGLFLKLFEGKLCEGCFQEYAYIGERSGKILRESISIINKSSKPETILSRVEVAKSAAKAILPYAKMGLDAAREFQPEEALAQLELMPNRLLDAMLAEELPKARAKSKAAKTSTGKLSPYRRLLDKFYSIQHYYDDMTLFEKIEHDVLREMDLTQIEAIMFDAEKEEFTGNSKKAIQKYKEALFEIRKDRIDDREQNQKTELIKSKILKLGGELPIGET